MIEKRKLYNKSKKSKNMLQNQLKTIFFLGLLSAIIIVIGRWIGNITGMIIGILIALAINFSSYWFSDKLILKIYKAEEVPKNHKIYVLVQELSRVAKIPTPKVYFIEAPSPNAFATGRNYKHSAVALTKSLIRLMSEEELKAVISHELSHIKNRDILIQTIAVGIATAIAITAEILQWTTLLFGFGGDDEGGLGNIFGTLIFILLVPIIATIIQLAISRQREFLADAGASKIMRTKMPMINALRKLESLSKPTKPNHSKSPTESLFIINPFRENKMSKLFSTHPTTQSRIEALKKLRTRHR